MKTHQERLAQWGLSLDAQIRERLTGAGIYAQTSVRRVHQDLAKRYVIRGEESGGATPEFGRYVTFADLNGKPLAYVQLVESLGGNGRHAIVVAPALLRIELLRMTTRVATTCDVIVTKHQLVQNGAEMRPEIRSDVIFRGVDGLVEVELSRKSRPVREAAMPRFLSRSAETLEIPPSLVAAVAAATLGASCIRCSHAHYSVRASGIREAESLAGTLTREASRTDSREQTTNGKAEAEQQQLAS